MVAIALRHSSAGISATWMLPDDSGSEASWASLASTAASWASTAASNARSEGAAAPKETLDYPARPHIVFLVPGLNGSAEHFSHVAETLQAVWPDQVVVHACRANNDDLFNLPSQKSFLTCDGIHCGGARIADEVLEVIGKLFAKAKSSHKRRPRFVSFWGHSMGGLYARYAVSLLVENGKICGLRPQLFLTTACPHMGVAGTFSSSLLAVGSAIGVIGCKSWLDKSGQQLFLEDKDLLLLEMAQDSRYVEALEAFKFRALIANVCYDWVVDFCVSALQPRCPEWLHTVEPPMEEFPHMAYDSGSWHQPLDQLDLTQAPPPLLGQQRGPEAGAGRCDAPPKEVVELPLPAPRRRGRGNLQHRTFRLEQSKFRRGYKGDLLSPIRDQRGTLEESSWIRFFEQAGRSSSLADLTELLSEQLPASGWAEDVPSRPTSVNTLSDDDERQQSNEPPLEDADGSADSAAWTATAATSLAAEFSRRLSTIWSSHAEVDSKEEAEVAPPQAAEPKIYCSGHPREFELEQARLRLAALPWRLVCMRFDDHPLMISHNDVICKVPWLNARDGVDYICKEVMKEVFAAGSSGAERAA